MIDGGRLDRAQNSPVFNELKAKSVFFSTPTVVMVFLRFK